jgi:hypothetical protein
MDRYHVTIETTVFELASPIRLPNQSVLPITAGFAKNGQPRVPYSSMTHPYMQISLMILLDSV